MRLFIAIRPPEEALEHLDAFLDVRRGAARGPRWTRPAQWHLTLAFAGDFPERGLDALEERLATTAAGHPALDCRLSGGGAFPDVAAARVLWLGVETDADALGRLAAAARTAVATSGGRVDGQRFRAHLTLGRFGRPAEATRWVRLLDAYEGPPWRADRVELVHSHLGGGAPRHDVVGGWPLGDQLRER